MVEKEEIRRIDDYIWELPRSYRSNMRVPARIYLSEPGLDALISESSLEQLVNVACLPGIERYALAMPDIHQGYGFPIGGVAGIRSADGVISPGGVGYDINCGVRLLTSQFCVNDLKPHLPELATQMQRDLPSGAGHGGQFALEQKELDKVLNQGMRWCLKRGYASQADMDAVEEYGCFQHADAQCISEQAKQRGADQLGTIGSGNHFVEIQQVCRLFDQEVAQAFGLFPDQAVVMIHTGSRGLGHQTCTDYVRLMNQVMSKYKIMLPDRELAAAPFMSPEGQDYFRAMAAAANFAWVNRQMISFQIRNVWKRVLGIKHADDLRVLYDVAHNIAKLERYAEKEYVVHRKGATRAFGPNNPKIHAHYAQTGQPVLIPGSMGTASYVLAGTEYAMQNTFGSCCHGAGRRLSRMKAKKTLDYAELLSSLENYGVIVRSGSRSGLVEEAPQAYKDIDQVIEVVAQSGIAKVVAKLKPLAVIKG